MDIITKCAHAALNMYNKIPLCILNLVSPVYHIMPETFRYGKNFSQQYHSLFDTEFFQEDVRKDIESELFLATVRNAYENVPYYHNIWDERGIRIKELKSIDDIVHLPFIDKTVVRENGDEMISKSIDKKSLIHLSTSGSTGAPLHLYQDRDIIMREWAYTNYIWSRVGYKPNSSRLVLRGKVFREQKLHGKNWQWDAFKRELSCNIFDMTEENLALYCRMIERYKPEFIHGYMSAIMILCKYIEKHCLKHHFTAVLATSETVYQDQREYVEKVLNTRLFSFYGHTERLVIAAECEKSTDYHVEPFYGYAEIIDKNGNIITDAGIQGELVATGFMNKSMPLIRYKTGDIAEWSEDGKCSCGRCHRRILRVAGRSKYDLLIKANGSVVSMTALNMHSDVYRNVMKSQFYQDTPGKVELRIVPTREYSQSDSDEIIRQLQEKLGPEMDITVILKNDIPLNKNGKAKIVDQRISL